MNFNFTHFERRPNSRTYLFLSRSFFFPRRMNSKKSKKKNFPELNKAIEFGMLIIAKSPLSPLRYLAIKLRQCGPTN